MGKIEYDVSLSRKELVFKSNELVQEAKFDLTTNEQKLILWAASKIRKEDTEFEEYNLSVAEFCEIMGIEKCSKNTKNIEDCLNRLALKFFWMTRADGARTRIQWFITNVIKDSCIHVRFHPDLRPYLLNLTEKFTAFELGTIVQMHSKYSIRIYELMKCKLWVGQYKVSVDEMKDWLQCAEYADYNNFKRRVLDVAVSEINAVSDLIIDFQPVRTGRKITDLVFSIEQNPFYGREMT